MAVPPVLKARQQGSSELTGTSLGVTVNAYDPTHSLLVFSYYGGDSTIPAQRGMVRGEKTNGTTITFYRGSGGGASCQVKWELLEFTEAIEVEDVSESGGGTANTTLGADTYSIISLGSTHTSPTTLDGDSTAELQLTTATNARRICGGSTGGTWGYQCVQTPGSGIQQVSGSASSQTVDPSISSVDPDTTLALITGRTSSSYDTEDVYRFWVLDATHLRLNRGASSGPTWNYTAFVLEFTAASNLVSGQQSNSGTNFTVTHSALTSNNSAIRGQGVHQCGCSNIAISGTSSQDTQLAMCSLARESDTTFRVIRQNGGGNIELSWASWEFESEANPTVIDESVTVSSGGYGAGPFTWNHTVSSSANRILFVTISAKGNNPADTIPSAVTYDGVAMTLAAEHVSASSGFHCRVRVYYMLDADLPSGGSYQVSVTMPSSNQSFNAVSQDVSNAAQQTYEATANNSSEAAPTTLGPTTITTLTDGAFILDSVAMDSTPDGTPSTGVIKDGYASAGGGGILVGHRHTATAENYTHSWDLDYATNRYAQVLTAWEPAGAVDLSGQSDGEASVSGSLEVQTDLDGESDGAATVSGTLDVSSPCTPAIETGNLAQGNAGSTTSHTLTNKNSRIVVVLIDDESTSQATGVTYDGVAMTKVAESTATTGAGNASSMWAILEDDLPASSGSFNVSVSGLDSGASVSVVELNGVAQVIPSGAAVDTNETGNVDTSSTTVTAPTGESISVGALGYGNDIAAFDNPPSGTGTWTRLFEIYNPPTSAWYGGAYQVWSSGGSKTYTETADATWFRASHIHAVFAACTGGTLKEIAGQSDGAATCSGSLDVLTSLAGASYGSAIVAGTLNCTRELECTSDGAASCTGSLEVLTDFDGESDGEATVEGTLEPVRGLEGESDGAATVVGSLNVLTALEGTSDGSSSVAGTVAVTRGLTGQSDGSSSVAGFLELQVPLEGQSDGSSSVAGLLEGSKPLDGTSYGKGTAIASLEVLTRLEGTSAGSSLVSGTLIEADQLTGESDGSSTVNGSLSVTWQLEGQSDGAADVSGSLEVVKRIEGSSAGEGGASATLNARRGLEGQSDGTSTASGTLRKARELEGASAGSATVVGSLEVQTVLAGLSAGFATVAGFVGVLTDLEGQSDGEADVSGSLGPARGLTGQSDGSSSVAGSLEVLTALEGSSAGAASVAGALGVRTALEGASQGVAAVAGALGVRTVLEGTSSGVGGAGAFLRCVVRLAGESDGAATVAGELDFATIGLNGQSDGAASVAGFLEVQTALEGTSSGVGGAWATLNLDRTHLEGESDGRARVSGSLDVATLETGSEILNYQIKTRAESLGGPRLESSFEVLPDHSIRSRLVKK